MLACTAGGVGSDSDRAPAGPGPRPAAKGQSQRSRDLTVANLAPGPAQARGHVTPGQLEEAKRALAHTGTLSGYLA